MSEDASASSVEVELADASNGNCAASDSLDRVHRGIVREVVGSLQFDSDDNVESVSVNEEEGALSSEGAHGHFARKLVLLVSVLAHNFFVAAVHLLVLGFDDVSLNLVSVSSLGKLPVDEHKAATVVNSDSGHGHLDGLDGVGTAQNCEGRGCRPSVVGGASSKRAVGSHAEVEGSTLDGSSSDSVAAEATVEEGRVQDNRFPVVSGVLSSHLSFKVGGGDAGVTLLVGGRPGDHTAVHAGNKAELGASKLKEHFSSADGRRCTPGSVSTGVRPVLNSESDGIAGFKVEVSVELVEGEFTSLNSGKGGIALALGDGDPYVIHSITELIGNLEHDSASLGRVGEGPGGLDSGKSIDNLGGSGRSSSPVAGQVLASIDGNGGDKDVSGAEVSVAVHDVEGDEGSPEEEHHDRREDSRNTGSTEFSANNEASEGEDHEADD